MKPVILGILASVTIFCSHANGGTAAGAEVAATALFTRLSPSIVTIHTFDDKDQPLAQGSGVVVAKRQVATNCHVLSEAARIQVDSTGKSHAAQWQLADRENDLCLLKVDTLEARPVSLRMARTVVPGERVVAIGNPLGFGLAISEGLIVTVQHRQDSHVIVTSAPLSPGSSGGGLFDQEGRLLGLTTAILAAGQNLNLVAASDGIRRIGASGQAALSVVSIPDAEIAWMTVANGLLAASDWKGLERHARKWIASQPTASPGWEWLGQSLLLQGRVNEAQTAVREALRLDTDYSSAWTLQAQIKMKMGDEAGADEALDHARRLNPSDSLPSRLQAAWRLSAKKYREARALAQDAIRRDAGRAGHWRLLAAANRGLGDQSAAEHALRVALRLAGEGVTAHHPDATPTDTGSGGVEQGDARAAALTDLGQLKLKQGRLGPAQDAFRKVLKLAPANVVARNGLGVVLMRLGRTREAEAAFDQVVREDPGNAEALSNRASARHALGRLDEARADAKAATQMVPESAHAWRTYAVVVGGLNNCVEAMSAFRKVDQLGEASADDLVSLGECQGLSGQRELGLKTLAKAEAMNPNLVRMHLSMAKLLGNGGDVAKAMSYLDRALEIEPSNERAWSSKGYGLMLMGRLSESAKALETAVRLNSELTNAWINLGNTRLRQHHVGSAIDALLKAVALNPNALDARLYLAQAYLASRQFERAHEQSSFVLKKAPTHPVGLGLHALASLARSDEQGASESYARLRKINPPLARSIRARALKAGFGSVSAWPE